MASRSSGRGGSNEPVSLSGCSKRVRSHVLSCWSCMVGGWLVGLLGTKRLSRPMCATMAPELSGRLSVASHIACEMKAKVASKSLPDVRHRGHRNPDRKQNRATNRFPMCATVAIGTQSLPDVRHRGDRNPDRNQNRSPNRCPTCATVAMGTQFETRIERQIACQLEPKIDTEIDPKSMQNPPPKGQNDSQIWPWGAQTTQEGPRRVFKSLLGRSWGSLWRSWGVLGRLLGSPGTPPGSTKVAKESPQTPQRPQNRPQNVSQDRKAGQPGSETTFDMIFV